jgi:AraC-like DNA-binding protein
LNNEVRFHDFPIAGVEAMTACTARSYPRHTHDEFGIGVVDSGGHASWSGRGHLEAGPGSFICVNPGEVHDGRAIGHRARSWRILYFEPCVMEELFSDVIDTGTARFTFATPTFLDPTLRGPFEAAFACRLASASRDRMACEAAVLAFVSHLRPHSTLGARNATLAAAPIRRARERIDADPAAPLTLADLAAESGLSRYQILRAFARETGLTPHAYILQRRIALARRLIRRGVDLAEAAVVAGFYDQSHLNRCFVRQFGVTPHRYALRAG